MKTYVTYGDYLKIKEAFTEEEIKEKYGYLKAVSETEYNSMKLKEKMKNKLRKEGKYYGN